jgi:hypothetical protein
MVWSWKSELSELTIRWVHDHTRQRLELIVEVEEDENEVQWCDEEEALTDEMIFVIEDHAQMSEIIENALHQWNVTATDLKIADVHRWIIDSVLARVIMEIVVTNIVHKMLFRAKKNNFWFN